MLCNGARYKAVIHKLSEKIEQASAQGFLANGEDGGALGRSGSIPFRRAPVQSVLRVPAIQLISHGWLFGFTD
eukprot:777338-Rhodomonas_salina.2